tara:strand:+ start:804 stop:1301 length:498 start_codon:yes stop_codon:yes gene_type:complete
MLKYMNVLLFNKILILTVSFSLIFALYLEYALNILPCKLCTIQRYLWILLFFICAINIYFKNSTKTLPLVSFFLLGLIVALSFYHSGIEIGFFNNVISCTPSDSITATSIEELDKLIRNTENKDCAFPQFFIFNLSLSNLSFILSTILLLLCLKIYKKNIFKNHG